MAIAAPIGRIVDDIPSNVINGAISPDDVLVKTSPKKCTQVSYRWLQNTHLALHIFDGAIELIEADMDA